VKSVATLAKSKDRSEFGLGFFRGTMLLLDRQKTIWLRDRPLLWGKLFEGFIVGLILGVLYYDVDPKYYLRTLFFGVAVFQRQAWQQITIAFQLRKVFYKQRSRNFFRTSSYAIAESVVQIPVNISVALILSTTFYWLSGLTRNFFNYLIFMLIILSFQHAIGAYMTMLSSVSPSITIGQAIAGISVAFFLLFSGNIILADLIPTYWIWMYWFDPIAWALRSVMLLEFHSSDYKNGEGQSYLDKFSISQGREFLWIGIGVLLFYYFMFTSFNALALHYIRYETHTGIASSIPVSPSEKKLNNKIVDQGDAYVEVATPTPEYDLNSPRAIPQSTPSQNGNNGLPFIPANLCIQDLSYFVTLPSGEEKQLLHEITAHFEPGRIVALMGSSGAGKTTLMDVIAGRKTGGRTTGSIFVNGELKDPKNFSRIAAYCEQMDIHSEGASIREALIFAANLRLPHTFTLDQRMNLVEETLDLLELRGIQHELILHLSVEQRKRVTIGVEVVSNPSILFLDEPTSGLDARSALIVMRGVRSISRTGRTVVCTIHQPSISIFELFDGLLLLQLGGFTAYFGDLGKDSVNMLEYFASIPGTDEIPPQYNPATYMLEVIGAGIGRDVKDYSLEYRQSSLCKENRERTLELSALSPKFVAFSTQNYKPIPTSFTNQLSELARKQRLTYWRNPQYNFMRLFLFPLFALIFGTAFFQLEANSVKKINSHVGLVYNLMDFIGVMNLMTVLEISCAERAVYYRERMSNYYSPLPFSLSLFFAEIPYLVLSVSFFATIAYWLIGVNNYFFAYVMFLFVFFLYTSICTFIGQWMSALTPNAKVANVAVGAISCVFNLFSGYLLPRPNMKGYYKWITYLVPSTYSLAALVTIELGDCSDLTETGCAVLNDPSLKTGPTTVAGYVSQEYDFRPDLLVRNVIILGVFWVVIQLFIYLTLKYVSHLKR
jgi:ABC-type multidrug transport system ATPase subunit/ABC-type multidrug transport system permease subunit